MLAESGYDSDQAKRAREMMTQPRADAGGRRLVLWATIATIWWTLDGVTDVMNYRVMTPTAPDLHRVWLAYMWSAWMWVPLTVQALWLSDRYPLSASEWRRSLPVHLSGAAVACVGRAALVAGFNSRVGWYAVLPGATDLLVASLANAFFLYWMLVGVGHALVYRRRVRERDAQLARAELHALKLQLQPHFLFNTLNTINTYVRADAEIAQRMILRLSDLLRRVLDSEGIQEVPLEEELALVQAYLDIEQVRFANRLRVILRIDPVTKGATVPHLVLQPLVENAIRHGISPRARAGVVEIRSQKLDTALLLSVRDDGVGWKQPSIPGRGLENTRSRLQQLYGDRQRMTVTTPGEGGFLVEMWIPFRVPLATSP